MCARTGPIRLNVKTCTTTAFLVLTGALSALHTPILPPVSRPSPSRLSEDVLAPPALSFVQSFSTAVRSMFNRQVCRQGALIRLAESSSSHELTGSAPLGVG